MFEIIIATGILFVALYGLVKSADIFTNASEKIGLYFGLSSFIVGATIVSIGSSLPELATSLISIVSGDPAQSFFAIDNVIGSNIANSLLVAGFAAIAVGTLKVKEMLIDVDLPFFFISSALFLLFILDGKFV
jgi:cation:H+ antiporter